MRVADVGLAAEALRKKDLNIVQDNDARLHLERPNLPGMWSDDGFVGSN
jgi:hypothetical protein